MLMLPFTEDYFVSGSVPDCLTILQDGECGSCSQWAGSGWVCIYALLGYFNLGSKLVTSLPLLQDPH